MSTTISPDVSARIAKRLADAVGPRRYAMWFDQSAELDYQTSHRTLRVAVPNRFVADWIGRHFQEDLHDAAHQEVGEAVALDVQVEPDRFAAPGTPAPETAGASPASQAEAASAAGAQRGDAQAGTEPVPAARSRRPVANPSRRRTPLSALRHCLDNFIVGPSNELAYAAAQRLANEHHEPGHPLFVHGSCGLGKTHLLQGLCRRLLEQHADAKVLYTTGEQFTNDYITAVRTNKLEGFRKQIRQLDLLAVDDVHFIANKQATQQEFLHSFDQIELGGARVVLASDSHPKLIKQFSEALVSRCVRGLVVPIHPPDVAMRRQLIQALAQRRNLMLDEPLVCRLAQESVRSVREIEGMLTKLQALAALTGHAGPAGKPIAGAVGQRLVRQLLDEQLPTQPTGPVRLDTILAAVAEELGVSRQQILGPSRHRLVVLARSLTIHLARQMTSMSYPEIAAAMGRKNHSTIITADQRIHRQLKADDVPALPPQVTALSLADLIDQLRRQIARG